MKRQSSTARPKNEYLAYRALDALLRNVLRLFPPSAWTERCALRWGFRFQPAPALTKLRSGALIQTTRTDYLQLLIYYLGTFEPHCLPYLKGCVGKGGTVLDVGANIGFYTLESAIAVGDGGRVISIEAAPDHITALRRNIELNGMKNISLIDSAVGDSTGYATLTLPRGVNLGMFTLGNVDGDEVHKVALNTIDDLLEKQNIDSLDFVKMDIEGSEYKALRGGAKTFAKYRPSLLIELNEVALCRCGASTREVVILLEEMGYWGWQVGRNLVQKISRNELNRGCDECLFIHKTNQSLMRKLRLPS